MALSNFILVPVRRVYDLEFPDGPGTTSHDGLIKVAPTFKLNCMEGSLSYKYRGRKIAYAVGNHVQPGPSALP